MANRYVPIPQNQQGRYVQITPQLAAQIQSRGQQQPQQTSSPLGPTQPSAPPAAYRNFQNLRQAINYATPFAQLSGNPYLAGGAGVLGGVATAGMGLTNPNATDTQRAVDTFRGALQAGGTVGQAAGVIGPTVGQAIPYVGTALGIGSLLASRAPENQKFGGTAQILAQLALTKLLSPAIATALGTTAGTGAGATLGTAAGAGAGAGTGAAGGVGTGAAAGAATGALAGLVAAPFAAALGGIIAHEIGPGDYAERRRKVASQVRGLPTELFDRLGMARNSEELESVIRGDWAYTNPNPKGTYNAWENLGRIGFNPNELAFSGGYEIGEKVWPTLNPQIQQYVGELRALHADPTTNAARIGQVQKEAFERWANRGGLGQNVTYTSPLGGIDGPVKFNISPSDPEFQGLLQQYHARGMPTVRAADEALASLIQSRGPTLQAEQTRAHREDWLSGLGTASA